MPSVKSLVWLAGTLIAFLCLESFLFRRGWYDKYLQPDSSAGSVEYPLYWLKRNRPVHSREVMVVGDSRMAEGFSAPQAELESGRRNITFWNFGIPGSSPRVWYYVLRDADPTRRRFDAIVFALDYFNDEDHWDAEPNRLRDINFVISRLRLSDIWSFASSYELLENRRAAMVGAALKGTVLQRDVRQFLDGVGSRTKFAREVREHGLQYLNTYSGHSEDVTGLSVDWPTRTIHFPPGLPEARKSGLRDALTSDLPPNRGQTTRYRKLWFGRILDLYHGSPTRIVFFETSRGPVPQPERQGPQAFLNWARQQPNVVVMDQRAFREFERPDLYFDGYHYNRKGRELFTARFTHLLLNIL